MNKKEISIRIYSLNKELHKDAKRKAIDLDVNVNDIYIMAIKDYLKK